MTVTTREPLSFEQLDAHLRDQGYSPGAPPRLKPENLIADRRAYQHFRCACGRRGGMTYHPYHDRQGHYKGLVACLHCGRGEEV